jgi:hypothetical protein
MSITEGGGALTWILLIPASLSARAIWFIKDNSRNATLPPFPDPPVTDSPHENFCSTPPADPLTGCGWVGVDTSGNPWISANSSWSNSGVNCSGVF